MKAASFAGGIGAFGFQCNQVAGLIRFRPLLDSPLRPIRWQLSSSLSQMASAAPASPKDSRQFRELFFHAHDLTFPSRDSDTLATARKSSRRSFRRLDGFGLGKEQQGELFWGQRGTLYFRVNFSCQVVIASCASVSTGFCSKLRMCLRRMSRQNCSSSA